MDSRAFFDRGGESFCPYRATGVLLPLPRAIALGYEGLPFQGAWMKEG